MKLNHQKRTETATRRRLQGEALQQQVRDEWRNIHDAEQERAAQIARRHAAEVPFLVGLCGHLDGGRRLSRRQVGAVLRIAQQQGWATALSRGSERPPLVLDTPEADAHERLKARRSSRVAV